MYAYGPATPAHFARWLAAPGQWAAGLFASLAGSGVIEEVAFEGVGPAWVVAGDTDFPADPVRGVRLLPYFDAFSIASYPRERLFPGRASERARSPSGQGEGGAACVDARARAARLGPRACRGLRLLGVVGPARWGRLSDGGGSGPPPCLPP
ncbi:winged helix DNA-binding domain-containing protein [Streptomyces cavourensis]|uniref:Winged helix DNA-binding domain-containing protein n=1 Tax=Streptomyces cavourensis TaxID=67258 RepID=A0ABY5FHY1_9ACTN|nr:crosslink repair DNA glycosylase YcaQ family protein [Streptomyces cavourensis]UTR83195.1 winged helix DNA-binding domain-containing protein [Streptomyces cavourensis]